MKSWYTIQRDIDFNSRVETNYIIHISKATKWITFIMTCGQNSIGMGLGRYGAGTAFIQLLK